MTLEQAKEAVQEALTAFTFAGIQARSNAEAIRLRRDWQPILDRVDLVDRYLLHRAEELER